MRTGVHKIRLEAALALLDRGYGRPAQADNAPLVNVAINRAPRRPLTGMDPGEAIRAYLALMNGDDTYTGQDAGE